MLQRNGSSRVLALSTFAFTLMFAVWLMFGVLGIPIQEEFGISEKDVTELMKTKLSKDNFELWKKKVAANKPKPKPIKYNELEDDDVDSKYYFKNKFD